MSISHIAQHSIYKTQFIGRHNNQFATATSKHKQNHIHSQNLNQAKVACVLVTRVLYTDSHHKSTTKFTFKLLFGHINPFDHPPPTYYWKCSYWCCAASYVGHCAVRSSWIASIDAFSMPTPKNCAFMTVNKDQADKQHTQEIFKYQNLLRLSPEKSNCITLSIWSAFVMRAIWIRSKNVCVCAWWIDWQTGLFVCLCTSVGKI